MSGRMRIGVVGGGRMGAGIAQSLVTAGHAVALVDAGAEAAGAARGRVLAGIARAVERGFAAIDAAEVEASITAHADVAELPPGLALVIEAVPEDPELKGSLLRSLSEHQPATTVIASNTSSISIDRLAESVAAPERFLGMHFFNPVPASLLVEVVRGRATSEAAERLAVEVTASIGKEAVVVTDSPGFASSRLGVLLGLEAIRMVEEGVAEPEAIDRAMTLGYGHRMGPLRSTDLVGLDVRLAIAEYLEQELGERFRPPELLRRLVAEGRLGRKSGRGFYEWPREGGEG